jgi:hypothetical protein
MKGMAAILVVSKVREVAIKYLFFLFFFLSTHRNRNLICGKIEIWYCSSSTCESKRGLTNELPAARSNANGNITLQQV